MFHIAFFQRLHNRRPTAIGRLTIPKQKAKPCIQFYHLSMSIGNFLLIFKMQFSDDNTYILRESVVYV